MYTAFSVLIWLWLVPYFIYVNNMVMWKRTVPNSLAREHYAKRLRVLNFVGGIMPILIFGNAVTAVVHGQFIWAGLDLLCGVYVGRDVYRDIKRFLSEDDFWKNQKSKFKRWVRNTFTVKQVVFSKVNN